MLKPEAAKQQLEQWRLEDSKDDVEESLLPRIAQLPQPLRTIGYAFFDRDARGEEISFDWSEKPPHRVQAGAELDSMAVDERVRFFGVFFPKLADQVELGWQFLKVGPYQTGFARKSFRAPEHPQATTASRCAWVTNLLRIAGEFRGEIITAAWLAAWAPHLQVHYGGADQDAIGRLLAAVIDSGGTLGDEIFEILTQSARGEHEIGAMGRHVTRGLLLASRTEGWEFMEKMLLAAQRQEGLRQTILETVDEAHPEAFRRMLRLIGEHDLARFSAVVRALDVWLGFQWDSISVKVVNDTLAKVLRLLDEEDFRDKALKGKQAEEVFLALWAVAFTDAFRAIPIAEKLLQHPKIEHRFVAALHLAQLGLDQTHKVRFPALEDEDLRVAWCSLTGMTLNEEDEPDQLRETTGLFEKLERLYVRLPAKPTLLKPLVWPWTGMRISRQQLAVLMLEVLGNRPATRLIPYLKDLDGWHRKQAVDLLCNQKKWDQLTRTALLDLAGDTSSDVRQAALSALAKNPLKPGEETRLESYLGRKTSDLRRSVIGLLGKQNDDNALASADRLVSSGDGNQRLAGLELLRQLAEADRQRKACQERVSRYVNHRKKLQKEEETQILAIRESGREKITLENAFGLMNPKERTPVIAPVKRSIAFITDAAVECIKSLDDFIHTHRETPVRYQTYSGVEEKLLGTVEWGFPSPDWSKPLQQNKVELPLRELWEQWRDQRPKELRDKDRLELVRAYVWAGVDEWDWKSWKSWAKHSPLHGQIVRTLSGGKEPAKLRYHRLAREILEWLVYLDPPKNVVDFLLDAVETTFALVPQQFLDRLAKIPEEEEENTYVRHRQEEKEDPDWREAKPFQLWTEALGRFVNLAGNKPISDQWRRYWHLMHWRDEPVQGARRDRPDMKILEEGYAASEATLADWYDQLLGLHPKRRYGNEFGELSQMTGPRTLKGNEAYFAKFPEIQKIVDSCRERILEVELARGEETTAATLPALALESLFSTDTLHRILFKLGKEGFKIGDRWRAERRVGRSATFTRLATVTYPRSNDEPEDFAKKCRSAVETGQLDQERILELAFLAPQWARHIAAYFGWAGFTEGLYWFLAHMSVWSETTERAAVSAGLEVSEEEEDEDNEKGPKPTPWDRLIMERTPLTEAERQGGAVDVAWFQRTYKELEPKRWEAMAAAARFSANAAQARRAQFVADVLLGKASRRELIRGIRGKKLKESVRLLGLLPLPQGNRRDADLAERYHVLQEYRRYAKNLSSMTKEGALRAVEIGMQNLARTAGYADPLRLEWAMEADSVKDLARGPVSAASAGVTVILALDERAQPQVTIRRGDKELKSVPPKVKKDKKIAALVGRVAELKRQSSRMKQSLERAMCRGDTFSGAELVQLCEHAILAPLLERLVLMGEGIIGFPDKKGKVLRNHKGKLEPVKKNESLRIAHPFDLLQTGQWDQWQHECFAAERMQPFKQIFRELYVVTKQEKADGAISRRYSGQQIQPKQAYALWGQRGWSTKEGVWKSFYELGITVSADFNYGITTPLEVEGLTIDTVTFSQRDVDKPVKLTEIPPRVFSEVMRDMDLVVSVAHRGGVDPEASASTVEMRNGLLRETCQLLNLKNVRVKDAHALIDGELGHYSVHLGSATVHKLPGGALCIVPVHAQHRGRLFLPFADDDPKTAEVVSKVLLLARDSEIQDPTVLEQLRRT